MNAPKDKICCAITKPSGNYTGGMKCQNSAKYAYEGDSGFDYYCGTHDPERLEIAREKLNAKKKRELKETKDVSKMQHQKCCVF